MNEGQPIVPGRSAFSDRLEVGHRAVELVGDLIAQVEVDPTAITPAELALAGLARCRRLVHGMLVLHDDAPDLVGSFARTHFETWVWSVYLLLEGHEAVARLQANDADSRRKHAQAILDFYGDTVDAMADGEQRALTEEFIADAKRVLDSTSAEAARNGMGTSDAAKKVSALLQARGKPNARYPEEMYVLLYRRESQQSVHGQLRAIIEHLGAEPHVREVLDRPPVKPDHDRRLELTVAGLLGLAGGGRTRTWPGR